MVNNEWRRSVDALLHGAEGQADRRVPAGIYVEWGEALGWPAWLVEGTNLEPMTEIPRFISLKNDMIILSNLLAHFGPERIIASLVDKRTPNTRPRTHARLMSAPDAISAIKFASDILSIQYPFLVISFLQENEVQTLSISSVDDGNEIGDFVSIMCLLFLFDIFRSYLDGQLVERASRVATIAYPMHLRVWRKSIGRLGCAVVEHDSTSMQARFPLKLLRARSNYYDSVIWSEALRWLQGAQVSDQVTISRERLSSAVRLVIEQNGRVPKLKEVAMREGISERTIARRLSDIRTSYQEIVDAVRSELAVERLVKGNASIIEIAHALGFSHSSSFARAFRSWHGKSPTQFLSSVDSLTTTKLSR